MMVRHRRLCSIPDLIKVLCLVVLCGRVVSLPRFKRDVQTQASISQEGRAIQINADPDISQLSAHDSQQPDPGIDQSDPEGESTAQSASGVGESSHSHGSSHTLLDTPPDQTADAGQAVSGPSLDTQVSQESPDPDVDIENPNFVADSDQHRLNTTDVGLIEGHREGAGDNDNGLEIHENSLSSRTNSTTLNRNIRERDEQTHGNEESGEEAAQAGPSSGQHPGEIVSISNATINDHFMMNGNRGTNGEHAEIGTENGSEEQGSGQSGQGTQTEEGSGEDQIPVNKGRETQEHEQPGPPQYTTTTSSRGTAGNFPSIEPILATAPKLVILPTSPLPDTPGEGVLEPTVIPDGHVSYGGHENLTAAHNQSAVEVNKVQKEEEKNEDNLSTISTRIVPSLSPSSQLVNHHSSISNTPLPSFSSTPSVTGSTPVSSTSSVLSSTSSIVSSKPSTSMNEFHSLSSTDLSVTMATEEPVFSTEHVSERNIPLLATETTTPSPPSYTHPRSFPSVKNNEESSISDQPVTAPVSPQVTGIPSEAPGIRLSSMGPELGVSSEAPGKGISSNLPLENLATTPGEGINSPTFERSDVSTVSFHTNKVGPNIDEQGTSVSVWFTSQRQTTSILKQEQTTLITSTTSSESRVNASTEKPDRATGSAPDRTSEPLTSPVSSQSTPPQNPVLVAITTFTTKKKIEPAINLTRSTTVRITKKNDNKEKSENGTSMRSTTPGTNSVLSPDVRPPSSGSGTLHKPETPVETHKPDVYMLIQMRMSWYEFCYNKAHFITLLCEIILNEKQVPVTEAQFHITNNPIEPCSEVQQNPAPILNTDSYNNIIVEMYIAGSDGKVDISLTIDASSVIVKGFQKTKSYFKDKILQVRVHKEDVVSKETSVHQPQSKGITMVIIIAGVGGCCCIVLVVLQLIMMHRRIQAKRLRAFVGQRASLQSMDHVALGVIPKSRPDSGYWNPALDDSEELLEKKDFSHLINSSTLANICMDTNSIFEEFQGIPFDNPSLASVPMGDEDKNRFANVLPHKHSRVRLKRRPGDISDYINANYVSGYRNERGVYIATQSPLVNTAVDFWRMVWEQQCRAILMLNPVQQNGKPKQSTCYWPDDAVHDSRREFGDFVVTLKKRDIQSDYIDCTLEIMDIERNLKREVHHFWLTCWPDTKPLEPLSLVKFVLDTRPHYEDSGSSVIVHCGPGTGRTGVLMAVDICMRMFEDRRMVDIQHCVHKMRRERAGTVQTREQYALIYQALNEYAVILSSPSISTRSSVITLHAML